jgi:diguanylate cyclase (GGDEF)-like protein
MPERITEDLIPILAYWTPIIFFMYMGIEVYVRNRSKTEHRLVAMVALCYALLFLGEAIRHELDIIYSPIMAGLWLSNIGVIIPGVGFHFLIKLTGMDKKMPRYLYPYIFYVSFAIIIVNILSSERITSAQQFIQQGIWKLPVYNTNYYMTMTIAICISALYLVPLLVVRRRAFSPELKHVYNLMILGVIIVFSWHLVFGYIQFGKYLPPYPYLYAGVIWCFILRLTMIRYDFLNYADKRYELLFSMNPAATLLIDLKGGIKEANPSAHQLFYPANLNEISYQTLLSREVAESIERRMDIRQLEMSIQLEQKQVDLILDGDYVLVDNEPHMILILRDITKAMESQREIMFLAYYDSLTRLPNRRLFYEKLDKAIQESKAGFEILAVILIDLNRFKEINDRYGHQAGDEVLKLTAGIIEEVVGPIGMASRLGGDEFVLFIRRVPTEEYVQDIIRELNRRIAERVLWFEGDSLTVEMSIGSSLFPMDGQDSDALINSADKAMYKVKRSAKVG